MTHVAVATDSEGRGSIAWARFRRQSARKRADSSCRRKRAAAQALAGNAGPRPLAPLRFLLRFWVEPVVLIYPGTLQGI